MLESAPLHPFTNNRRVSGGDQDAKLIFHVWSETGKIIYGDTTYDITKESAFTGFWTLELNGESVMSAKKPSSIQRAFEIYTDSHLLSLEATSMWSGRTMILSGDGYDVTFKPKSIFSGKANITGPWEDFLTVCFAHWLVALMWKRAQGAGAS